MEFCLEDNQTANLGLGNKWMMALWVKFPINNLWGGNFIKTILRITRYDANVVPFHNFEMAGVYYGSSVGFYK